MGLRSVMDFVIKTKRGNVEQHNSQERKGNNCWSGKVIIIIRGLEL